MAELAQETAQTEEPEALAELAQEARPESVASAAEGTAELEERLLAWRELCHPYLAAAMVAPPR